SLTKGLMSLSFFVAALPNSNQYNFSHPLLPQPIAIHKTLT
ncbi:MAG: hypothetical protein ACI8RO_000532, partial [Flavobacteriales bacterium]